MQLRNRIIRRHNQRNIADLLQLSFFKAREVDDYNMKKHVPEHFEPNYIHTRVRFMHIRLGNLLMITYYILPYYITYLQQLIESFE